MRAQFGGGAAQQTTGMRMLKEVSLDEPIRYGLNDPIEQWLNDLLCLKATVAPLNNSTNNWY